MLSQNFDLGLLYFTAYFDQACSILHVSIKACSSDAPSGALAFLVAVLFMRSFKKNCRSISSVPGSASICSMIH